jgi:hypothetical protein
MPRGKINLEKIRASLQYRLPPTPLRPMSGRELTLPMLPQVQEGIRSGESVKAWSAPFRLHPV